MTIAVKRALSLLDLFTESQPEVGLSEAARDSGLDKATVHRLLNTLRESGLVEQNPRSKLYRLGPAVLHLARMREATFPTLAVVQPVLDGLAELTGETTHCSFYTNAALAVIACCESKKANRVSMRGSETLPFHATASGHVFLAFAGPDHLAKGLAQPMPRFTATTCATTTELQAAMQGARQRGFASIDRSYEDDVFGIAAPLFGAEQRAIGALAVATPCHRMTPELQGLIQRAVMATAVDLTRKLGHEPPPAYLALLRN